MRSLVYFLIGLVMAIFMVIYPPISWNKQLDNKNIPLKETALISEEILKLPTDVEADIFLTAGRLPIFPIRNWRVPEPELSAKIALIYDTGHREILYQKNGLNEQHPIASITKLMTALVAIENTKPEAIFKVSKKAVETPGEMGDLAVGEELTVKNLLFALLVASSNDAAQVIAENLEATNGQNFIDLMNKKARELNLQNTHFKDASGLDPQNYSSAWDLSNLLQKTLQYPLLKQIMQTAEIDIFSIDGRFVHRLISTNKLLREMPEIIGGKTGYTQEAGNGIIVAFKSPSSNGYITALVLESQDRLGEIKILIEWTKEAYIW